jgi:hypothetical protein
VSVPEFTSITNAEFVSSERPSLVGEVSGNFFLRTEGVAWSAWRILAVVISAF